MATSTTPNYNIDYEDERFAQVEADKAAALVEADKTYDSMIGQADSYYNAQINASKDWATQQGQLQQEQTDFAIEQIEQQKDQAKKDYTKEQSGAYVDWQKQSNQYGAKAEQMAAAGLAGSGFSESSQVSMYNTYQNRVATARESFNKAVMNYNNSITEARLQNNSILAEIAHNALQQQLELSLQGFQYKNNLLLEKANKKLEIDQIYHSRWMDVLNQMNTENALDFEQEKFDEQNRQWQASFDEQNRQWQASFDEDIRQFNTQYNESVRQFNLEYEQTVRQFEEDIRQFELEIAEARRSNDLKAQQLEEEKKAREQAHEEWLEEMKLKREELAEDKRQFDETMAARLSSSSSSSGSFSTNKPSSSGSSSNNNNSGNSGIDETDNNSSGPTINNESVLALGYGPIGEKELADKVAKGEVIMYEKDGQIYFRKNTTGLK